MTVLAHRAGRARKVTTQLHKPVQIPVERLAPIGDNARAWTVGYAGHR